MYIPLGDHRKLCWGTHFFPKFRVFTTPMLDPKRSPAQNVGPRGPELAPRPKHEKDVRRKMVQNPAGINSHGATRCKLRPRTILGATLDFLDMEPAAMSGQGAHMESGRA